MPPKPRPKPQADTRKEDDFISGASIAAPVKQQKEGRTQLSLRMANPLLKRVDSAAKARGTTRSSIIFDALYRWLEENGH